MPLILERPLTVASKMAFSATIWSIVFSLGGSIAMCAAVNVELFGLANAADIYSFVFSGFAYCVGFVGNVFRV